MDRHRNPDGTYDGIGVMSELTGLSRPELERLADEVKANHARLQACPYHEFVEVERRKYRCQHCCGDVGFTQYVWHERGRRMRP